MAIGDDAIAAGMANVNGATTPANTIDTELMLTRDYIAQGKGSTDAATAGKVIKRDANGRAKVANPSAATDIANKTYVDTKVGTLGAVATEDVVPVSKGGTGATSASSARGALGVTPANIGAAPTAHTHSSLSTGPVSFGWDGGLNRWNTPEGIAASSAVVGGDVNVGGHIYVPNATIATAGWTAAFIDGTGRITRGASSERFKKHISPIEPSILGDLFPQLFRFQMRHGDGSWRFGYIAERLAESDALRPFVVWETEEDGKTPVLDGKGLPIALSIDFISLLMAQVAQLAARVAELEARS